MNRRSAKGAWALGLWLFSSGCGDDESRGSTTGSSGGGGGGVPNPCAADQIPLPDGTCLAVGVAACPSGFTAIDAGGCEPLAWPDPTMDCGAAPWGDIPVEAGTVYVDQSYTALDADGSAARPYPTILGAMAFVPEGGMLAIAAGDYAEHVQFPGVSSARVWGRCPDLVTIRGDGDPGFGSVEIADNDPGSELHGVRIEGAGFGIAISGASEVLLDHVVITGVSKSAISIEDALGAASATVRDTLIYDVVDTGITAGGSAVTVERSVIRDVAPSPATGIGGAIAVIHRMQPAFATVSDTLLEGLTGVGIGVVESSLSLERSVVRDVAPLSTTGEDGAGIVQLGRADGSDTLLVAESYIARVHEGGIIAIDTSATISDTTLREVLPQEVDQRGGAGIVLQRDVQGPRLDSVVFRVSVADMSGFGVLVADAAVSIGSAWVTRTSPLALDELFGDAVTVASFNHRAEVTVDASRFDDSDRAGLSNFSSAVDIGRSMFECNPIDLDGEDTAFGEFTFSDAANNVCGCLGAGPSGGPVLDCKVTTANLSPPSPP